MGLRQNSYESLDQIQETIYARKANKKQQALKHKEETTMTTRFHYGWARLFGNFHDVFLLKSIHEIELEQLKQANVEAPAKLLKLRKIKQFLCERSEKQTEQQEHLVAQVFWRFLQELFLQTLYAFEESFSNSA
jgi:hypothetical protein